jgi:hypothetical protein
LLDLLAADLVYTHGIAAFKSKPMLLAACCFRCMCRRLLLRQKQVLLLLLS